MIKKLLLENAGGPLRYSEISSAANAIYTANLNAGSVAGMYDAPNGTSNATIGSMLALYNGGASMNGVGSVGQQNITKKVKYIKIYQGYWSIYPSYHYFVSSMKVQKCIDGTNWVDIQTVDTTSSNWAWQKITVNDYTFSGTHKIRLLCNANVYEGNNTSWVISELRMFVEDPAGTLKASDI